VVRFIGNPRFNSVTTATSKGPKRPNFLEFSFLNCSTWIHTRWDSNATSYSISCIVLSFLVQHVEVTFLTQLHCIDQSRTSLCNNVSVASMFLLYVSVLDFATCFLSFYEVFYTYLFLLTILFLPLSNFSRNMKKPCQITRHI
jgi:hypothetical protein